MHYSSEKKGMAGVLLVEKAEVVTTNRKASVLGKGDP